MDSRTSESKRALVLSLLLLLPGSSLAQIQATTPDGREVILFPDGRWEFAPPERQPLKIYSLDNGATPIHIGDARGGIEDIREKYGSIRISQRVPGHEIGC